MDCLKIKYRLKPDHLRDQLSRVGRYTSKEEKEYLLLEDEADTEKRWETLFPNSDLEPLNEIETLALMLKARENSVSDLLEGMIECPKCKAINDYNIELGDLIILDREKLMSEEEIERFPDLPIGVFMDLDEVIDPEEYDNLPLHICNELSDIIQKNNSHIINLVQTRSCRICTKDLEIPVSPLMIISRVSLSNIYQEYFTLSFYTNNSVRDIDSLYPFERELMIGLAKKKLETPEGAAGALGNLMGR